MKSKVTTLTEVIEQNRSFPRNLTYLEGENDVREVSFGELYERALGILYHLQRMGARRGDKLILFLGNNEQFVDVFWAAILGGLVPVPVALGISAGLFNVPLEAYLQDRSPRESRGRKALLLRIELDDELLLHRRRNLVALRLAQHLRGEPVVIGL